MEDRQFSNSIYMISRKIKRNEQSLYNSLRSIYQDSLFVGEIRHLWPHLPLLANLRCGLWYAPDFDGSCYFKSTDGHTGNCSFSLTRLNMHVAYLAAQKGGCFIVDATRRGKFFPDSLTKTIPIWACVLNRAVYQYRNLEGECAFAVTGDSVSVRDPLGKWAAGTEAECQESSSNTHRGQHSLIQELREAESGESRVTGIQSWDCSLHLPLWVSDSEKEHIERRIDEWVKILNVTGADIATLAESLTKPLRPLWISQRTVIWLNEVPDSISWSFTPVILVSASQPLPSARRLSDGDFGWSYIPGAADDEESWARGLSPVSFWKHALSLINSPADDCNRMVSDIVERERVCRAYKGLEAKQIRVRSSKKAIADNHETTAECKQDQTDTENASGMSTNSYDSQYYHGRNDNELSQPEQPSDFHWIGKTRLAVSSTDCVLSGNVFESVDCAINCGVELSLLSRTETSNYLYLPCVSSKHDRFSLQSSLSHAVGFARERLRQGCTLLFFCLNGEDLSVSVCLTILLATFDETGHFDDGCNFATAGVSKFDVRQRLVYLCNFVPNARPSRGSLRQVYNFLSKFSVR